MILVVPSTVKSPDMSAFPAVVIDSTARSPVMSAALMVTSDRSDI